MPQSEKQRIKPGSVAHRFMDVAARAIDSSKRTAQLAFSSEAECDRGYIIEILDHSQGACRLGRLGSGRAPLLVDHENSVHKQVGVITQASIDADRVGRVDVRFGKAGLADEVFANVVDGIIQNTSVGYMIHNSRVIEMRDGVPVVLVTDWEPFEVSMVAVPFDPNVGVDRGLRLELEVCIDDDDDNDNPDMEEPMPEAIAEQMSDTDEVYVPSESVRDETETNKRSMTMPEATPAAPEAATQQPDANKRALDIIAIGEQYASRGGNELAREFVRNGKTTEEFRAALLEKISNDPLPSADIGLDKREVRKYSMLRAINALANPTDKKAQEAAAFERECSDAVSAVLGRSAKGFLVPSEVLKRDLTVGTATAGGDLVSTNLLSGSFIDLLRNKMALTGLGVQYLTGLVGDIAIPKQSGGATAYWVAESGAPTESQQTLAQVTMSPKTVGAFTDISRKLLLQSSIPVEGFVQNDLATVLALAIQQAGINGTGASNQPTGILNTTGIGDVAGGTNGAAPSWPNMIALETDVAVANADVGSMGYLTNAAVRGKLKGTFKNATYGSNPVWEDGNMVNGYRAAVTNAVPSNLTKGSSSGVCSAIVFGNFADLIIGMWGGLDLTVDPYTGSTSGTVRVVALQDVDVAVRHAESFSAMLDALTA